MSRLDDYNSKLFGDFVNAFYGLGGIGAGTVDEFTRRCNEISMNARPGVPYYAKIIALWVELADRLGRTIPDYVSPLSK